MHNEINPSSIVKNSHGEIYFFYLNNDNIVKYERFSSKKDLIDTNTLHKDKVMNFSVDIDRTDRVHVLCLTYEGKLIYFLYSNSKWSSSIISNFDIKSNKYSNLIIKANNDNLHIMYAFSNLINSSAWTIQHIMCIKNKWDKINVISITTGKQPPYFNIDFDKFDNIHLVYKLTSRGKESIYYISFNILLKKWTIVPQLISDMNISTNNYPYLFIDLKDNIHIVWCTLIDNEYQLSYKHLPTSGYNSFRWKIESLPVQKGSINHPILFEEKSVIKIIYLTNNTLKTIISTDNGFTWKAEHEKDLISPSNQKPMSYSSNYHIENNKSKINDVYLNAEFYSVQLPNFSNDLEKLIEVEKYDSQDIPQNESKKNLPNNEPTFLQEDFPTLINEIVRDFIISIKNSIEAVDSSDERIRELKSKLEKIILDNSLRFDQSITDYSKNHQEMLLSLQNFEMLINCYRNENKSILELVNSIEEIIVNRENTLKSLEIKITQLKEAVISYSNQSTLKKIISAFKKEV